jgi:hypothetical protein
MQIYQAMPLFDYPTEEEIFGQRLSLKPLAVRVFACVTPKDTAPKATTHRFPIVIDTGHSHNCSLSAIHLLTWAQMSLALFPERGQVPVVYADGTRGYLPLRDGNLWLFSNRPQTPPFKLELDRGFTFYATGGPRFPLLGVRALRRAKMCLTVDYGQMHFHLSAP